MVCRICNSEAVRELPIEANVHFRGGNALNTPALLLFPRISFCLECGFAETRICERDLKEVRKLDALASGANQIRPTASVS